MELVGSTQQRLDVLEQSISRISSQSEQHGAVQQVRASHLTLSVVASPALVLLALRTRVYVSCRRSHVYFLHQELI